MFYFSKIEKKNAVKNAYIVALSEENSCQKLNGTVNSYSISLEISICNYIENFRFLYFFLSKKLLCYFMHDHLTL